MAGQVLKAEGLWAPKKERRHLPQGSHFQPACELGSGQS